MAVTKDELQREARELGLDIEGLNRDELEARVADARQGLAALGPVVPAGEDAPQANKAVGSITGVQPLEEDDIPEAGR